MSGSGLIDRVTANFIVVVAQRSIRILLVHLSHFLARGAIVLTKVARRVREEVSLRVGANLEGLTGGSGRLRERWLTVVLNLGDCEGALREVESLHAAPLGSLRLRTVVGVGLLEEVAEPEQLLLVHLDLLI